MRVLEVPGVGLEVSLGTARSSEEGGHGEKGGREGKGAGGEEVLQPPTCPAGPDRTGCITSFVLGRGAQGGGHPASAPPAPLPIRILHFPQRINPWGPGPQVFWRLCVLSPVWGPLPGGSGMMEGREAMAFHL